MMIPDIYNVQTSSAGFEKSTSVGAVPDHQEFTGRISVIESKQGYDKIVTFTEYAAQVQIQRRLASENHRTPTSE